MTYGTGTTTSNQNLPRATSARVHDSRDLNYQVGLTSFGKSILLRATYTVEVR